MPNFQDPVKGGGYTMPKHIHIPTPGSNDLGDGHVAHPTGHPTFGLMTSRVVPMQPLMDAHAIAKPKQY